MRRAGLPRRGENRYRHSHAKRIPGIQSCRARVSPDYAPRIPGDKAARAVLPALGGGAHPCAPLGLVPGAPRGPLFGLFAARGGGWVGRLRCGGGVGVSRVAFSWFSWGGAAGAVRGAAVAVARAGPGSGGLGGRLGAGRGGAGPRGSGRAGLAVAGAAGAGLSGAGVGRLRAARLWARIHAPRFTDHGNPGRTRTRALRGEGRRSRRRSTRANRHNRHIQRDFC